MNPISPASLRRPRVASALGSVETVGVLEGLRGLSAGVIQMPPMHITVPRPEAEVWKFDEMDVYGETPEAKARRLAAAGEMIPYPPTLGERWGEFWAGVSLGKPANLAILGGVVIGGVVIFKLASGKTVAQALPAPVAGLFGLNRRKRRKSRSRRRGR